MSNSQSTAKSFLPYLGLCVLACPVVLGVLGCGKDAPALSPEQALQTFQLPAGFRIELVAAEPQVTDPVAMAFDAQGRLFVVEMLDYPLEEEPKGRIKLLEDRDGDGRFERSTVFADKLHFPNGVMAWREGILITSAPDILYLADTDGDDRADLREVALTGFAKTNPQLRVNGLQYAIDNWIYVAYPRVILPERYREFGDSGAKVRFPSHSEADPLEVNSLDVRFHPGKRKVEAAGGNSEFGNAFDAWGNRFTVWNNDHVRHVVIPNRYLDRNPYLGTRSAMQSASDHENAARVFPIAEKYSPISDSERGRFTSAAGISVYTGGAFPADYEGSFFVCEPVHHLIHRDVFDRSGPTFVARRAHTESEFLASTDSWFSPAFTTTGPDGALYVVDYYRAVLEHPEWIPPEILDGVDLYAGTDRGRIYRIVHESAQTVPQPRLRELAAPELVAYLSNPNMWWRITAQRLLVERRDRSVVPLLVSIAQSEAALGRLHALWTLEGMNALDRELLLRALSDPVPGIRENAIRLAEDHLSDSEVKQQLYAMANDPDPKVQFQVALTLGELREEKAVQTLQEIALRHQENPWFQTAVLSSWATNAGRWFRALSRPEFLRQESEGKKEFLRQVASIIGARQEDGEMAVVLRAVAKQGDSKALWWRAAALKGMSEGVRRGSQVRPALPRVANALIPLLDAETDDELRSAAVRLAAGLTLPGSGDVTGLLRNASKRALNENTSLPERAHAIRVLGLDPTGSTAVVLKRFLAPQQPREIQLAAVEAFGTLRDPTAPETLLGSWRTYTGPVREAVLRVLFDENDGQLALLEAIESEQVQRWSLNTSQRRRLLRSPNSEVRRWSEVLFANAAPEERRAIYEEYLPALHREGDAGTGQQVFERVCSKCHKIGGTGHEVGPDLLSVTTRNREVLLHDVLMPNESIEPGYEEYLVETTDGRSISGIVVAQTATSLVLRRAKGEEDTIPRGQITDLRTLSVSAMPEDLEKDISIQEMADLLAYLKNL